jgi:hypothetical protein
MSYRITAVVFLACFLFGELAFPSPKLLQNLPLKWTPTQALAEMGPVDVSGPLLTIKIHIDPFVDARQDPSTIAENRENAGKFLPVTTSSDVAAFITEHLKEILRGAAINVVDGSGDVTLSGDVRQFFVMETNLYHGDLSLLVRLKNVEGKEIWSGVIVGGAEHFGRSYKAENYYETMSDMVLNAAHNLLTNSAFHEALKGH